MSCSALCYEIEHSALLDFVRELHEDGSYSNIGMEIPYGKGVFKGGTNDDGYPCTRNGFLGSKNDEIIPEWWVRNRGEIAPEPGAELHQVIDGIDTIVAIFKDGHFLEP